MVLFLDRIRYILDMREEVVPFPPQGVITEDNLIVSIDSVIYFQIVDPVRAAYEDNPRSISAPLPSTPGWRP